MKEIRSELITLWVFVIFLLAGKNRAASEWDFWIDLVMLIAAVLLLARLVFLKR